MLTCGVTFAAPIGCGSLQSKFKDETGKEIDIKWVPYSDSPADPSGCKTDSIKGVNGREFQVSLEYDPNPREEEPYTVYYHPNKSVRLGVDSFKALAGAKKMAYKKIDKVLNGEF
jgi:hypothetical protein